MLKNRIISFFILILAPLIISAEEQSLDEQITEVNELTKSEKERNQQLKQEVDSREAELAELKEKLESLEADLNKQEK